MSATDAVRRLSGIHQKIANDVPQIRRGMVWCTVCGHSEKVNGADALRYGWPKHCGYTMTIDSPHERATRRALEVVKEYLTARHPEGADRG